MEDNLLNGKGGGEAQWHKRLSIAPTPALQAYHNMMTENMKVVRTITVLYDHIKDGRRDVIMEDTHVLAWYSIY